MATFGNGAKTTGMMIIKMPRSMAVHGSTLKLKKVLIESCGVVLGSTILSIAALPIAVAMRLAPASTSSAATVFVLFVPLPGFFCSPLPFGSLALCAFSFTLFARSAIFFKLNIFTNCSLCHSQRFRHAGCRMTLLCPQKCVYLKQSL